MSKNLGLVQTFFVLDKKLIDILCQSQIFCARPKNDFHSVNSVFVPAVFEAAQDTILFLVWLKKFELAQIILGPVKGEGILK